jgi:cytochrome P450
MVALDDELRDLVIERAPDALADPFRLWDALREAAPAHRVGARVFVTRYDDVKRLCQDTSTRYALRFADSPALRRRMRALSAEEARASRELWRFAGLWMVGTAGEDHARLRRIAQRAFSARRIAQLADTTRRHADELVASLAAGGVTDVMPMAHELPLRMITDLLGCPPEDGEPIAAWSAAIAAALEPAPPDVIVRAYDALRSFTDYVARRVQLSRRAPVNTDLIATLLDARDGDGLSEEELVAMFVLLLFAGHETTVNLIAHGLHQLLTHPDQWRLLCAQPQLWPNAVEELLRFVSPVQYVMRPVGEPHVVAGEPLHVGDLVLPVIAAANRDPRSFASPSVLDVARPDAKTHLALGFGARYCLGNALARMTAGALLAGIARRFPGVRLASGELRYAGTPALRRLEALPVATA